MELRGTLCASLREQSDPERMETGLLTNGSTIMSGYIQDPVHSVITLPEVDIADAVYRRQYSSTRSDYPALA